MIIDNSELYKFIAKKNNLPTYKVEMVIKSAFELVVISMGKKEYENIMLNGFGKWLVSRRKAKLHKLNKYGEVPGDIDGMEESSD